MANSKFEHSVDEILKTVQQRQAQQPPSNDAAVDEILAGLGLGGSIYSALKKPGQPPEKGPEPQPKPAAPLQGRPESEQKPAQPLQGRPESEQKPAQPQQKRVETEQKPAQPQQGRPESEQKPAQPQQKRVETEQKPAQPLQGRPDRKARRVSAPEERPESARAPWQTTPAVRPIPAPLREDKPAAPPEAAAETGKKEPAREPEAAAETGKKTPVREPEAAAETGKKTPVKAPETAPETPPEARQKIPSKATDKTGGSKAAASAAASESEEENEPTREFAPVTGPDRAKSGRQTPAGQERRSAAQQRPEQAAAQGPEQAAAQGPEQAAAQGRPSGPAAKEGAPEAPAQAPGAEGAGAQATAKAIQESVEKGPAVRPLETKTGVLHLNEIVNEDFTRFFSETVAVVPPEEERSGLFQRITGFFRKESPAPPPEEEETLRPEMTGEVRLDQDEPLALDELNGPPEEEEAPPPRRRLVLPRIFGVEEPEEEGPFTDEEPEALLDDYAAREDAPSVQADLTRKCAGLRLRCVLTGLLAALLLYLGLCAGGLLPSIPSLDPVVAPAAYFGVSLLLLLAAAAVSLPAMQSGLAGLFGTPSPSSMPALAVLAAAVQLVVLLLDPEAWLPDSMTLFAAPAALLLCLDAAGKQMMSGVVARNFEIVSSGIDHVAAYRLRDKKLAEKAAAGLAEPEPDLLVSRPTALVKGFLHQSFSERWSDRLAQRLCWALWGCGVLAAVIAAVKGGGLPGAVSVLAGTLCLGGPLSCTLLAALPSLLMQQSASRVGAVVPGWSAVHEMSRANVVVVGARDIFPSSSVVLHGIKTFEKERIDLAILYAASVLIEGCDTLKDVFLSIIQNKTEMLYPVESLTHEVGGGFIAWVEHNRVILGGRAMMQAHDIRVPSMDFEERYTRNGRYQPIYLAVSGKLFGMFVVSYRPDPEVADVLKQLVRGGISVLVKSDDFSITAPLIQRVYRVREGSVKVLSGEERKALAPATAYLPESEGCMTHLGSFASFVGGLQAAEAAAGGERAAALVQAVSVVCSCGLALLLSLTGGLAGLALPALILYQSAWSALALAMPLLKKY